MTLLRRAIATLHDLMDVPYLYYPGLKSGSLTKRLSICVDTEQSSGAVLVSAQADVRSIEDLDFNPGECVTPAGVNLVFTLLIFFGPVPFCSGPVPFRSGSSPSRFRAETCPLTTL